MILPLHEQVRARVRAVLAQRHGVSDPDLVIPIESPPNRTLGDLERAASTIKPGDAVSVIARVAGARTMLNYRIRE